MASNRRRRRRRNQEAAAPREVTAAATKAGWRQTIDSWGGFTVLGSLAAALLVVVALVVLNLPGSSVGDGDWEPANREQVSGRVAGSPTAPVRIVEFADFQCPHCQTFALDLEPTIHEEYVATGEATLELHYFPFIGEESFAAAAAAECAADQNRFWDYHDILFLRQGASNQGAFSTSNLKRFARELQAEFTDFDLGEFDQCVDSGRHEALVEELRDQAVAAGVSSTPSFLINGQAFGSADIEAFRTAIDAAVEASSGASTSGEAAAGPSGGGGL